MSRRILLLAVAMVALPRAARAEACPPSAALAGDPCLIAEVGDLLAARGISGQTGRCPAITAHLERRGSALAIEVVQLDGTTVERVVDETRTAATVIESFTRGDVGNPLLATRALPSSEPRDDQLATEPTIVAQTTRAAGRGVHVFGAFETSLANDRTGWVGAHLGACIMLGPVCAAARARLANVVGGPGVWNGQVERRSVELLFGIDVPFAVGTWQLSPGFAAGLGQMHTLGATHEMRSETGGMRADVHATLSIPMTHHLALDVFAAADLTQQTSIELGPMVAPLPPEPRLLVRFGLGLHYGGL